MSLYSSVKLVLILRFIFLGSPLKVWSVQWDSSLWLKEVYTHLHRKWQPTPFSHSGESHGQRSLAGYSPWGRKGSDTTEVTWCTYPSECKVPKNSKEREENLLGWTMQRNRGNRMEKTRDLFKKLVTFHEHFMQKWAQ